MCWITMNDDPLVDDYTSVTSMVGASVPEEGLMPTFSVRVHILRLWERRDKPRESKANGCLNLVKCVEPFEEIRDNFQ
jgi:hypothetical protein